ncbi:GNAT family N-acetyltransferase [Sphingobacterium sp. SGL-16]|uniref:GNAT family N-acetyltransferase n=1 Tax=Sphingobacterium sp. SGL-16 TaxID=2710883 RepID=UPI0013E99F37|nr:GNAT family N-acetyltransferase [Sphingobacterium sp. SGL-16]NGM74314.1 GNAT family N-acetyltransferase [Sphingobacterium sp. SGL-16]
MTSNLKIQLKPTRIIDLPILFQFQLDEESGYLAAFMPEDVTDEEAYLSKYTKLLSNSTVNHQTIWFENNIVGSVSKFIIHEDNEITYWIDKKYWGKGIATHALKLFLASEIERPIFGRVVFDNFRSQKVLEKCGFLKVGSDRGFANARQK